MPRRRKKSSSQRKPSLIFTESPVNLTYNYESPVRCADHPQTARAVPVDELADLTWVSPQFHGPPTNAKPRRQRRSQHSRSYINTRSRATGNSDSVHTSFGASKQLPRGFVPLRLEWDRTKDGAEIDNISEVETDGEASYTHGRQELDTSATETPPTAVLRVDGRDTSTVRQRLVPLSDHDVKSPLLGASPGGLDETRRYHTDRIHPKTLFRTNGNGEENSKRPVRRSERLRVRYQEAVQLLRSPLRDSDNEPTESRVLVTDTPECDYGRVNRPGRHKTLKHHILS